MRVGSQRRSEQVRKILPPSGFDPRTVQPVASRYTDNAITATLFIGYRSYFTRASNQGVKLTTNLHLVPSPGFFTTRKDPVPIV